MREQITQRVRQVIFTAARTILDLFSSRGSDDNVLSKRSQLGVMNKPSLSRTPFSFGTVAWS